MWGQPPKPALSAAEGAVQSGEARRGQCSRVKPDSLNHSSFCHSDRSRTLSELEGDGGVESLP